MLEKIAVHSITMAAMAVLGWYLAQLARSSKPESTTHTGIYGPNIIARAVFYGGIVVWGGFLAICYFENVPYFITIFFAGMLLATLFFGRLDPIETDEFGITQQRWWGRDVHLYWTDIVEVRSVNASGPG